MCIFFKHAHFILAQSRGFEPPKVLPLLVFETSAFNHSAKTAYNNFDFTTFVFVLQYIYFN